MDRLKPKLIEVEPGFFLEEHYYDNGTPFYMAPGCFLKDTVLEVFTFPMDKYSEVKFFAKN